MPVPKFKVLKTMCKHYDLTPKKVKKIILDNNIINSQNLIELLEIQHSVYMDQFHAQYIISNKEYLY